jgi:hypothetical protein
MFDRMTNKTRFYAVLFGFLLVMLIVYRLNIKKTIFMIHQYHEIKSTINQGVSNSQRLLNLQNHLREINLLLGSNISGNDLHEKIIDKIVEQSNEGLKIWEFPKSQIFANESMEIYTYKLTLTGDFKSIVKFVNELEAKEKLSRIRSVNFEMKKIRETNSVKLYAEIFLQNITVAKE